jgi:release factor glutamine methyltransferase
VGVDIDKAALKVAKINKKRLKIKNFFIFYSNWFDNISSMYDVIIANPPYLDFSQKDFSPDILYEPHKALFAQNNGLLELQKIITRSVKFCKKYLIVEHNPEQQQQVHDFFNQAGYTNMQAILNIKHNAQATIGEKSDI